jgi:IS605 OrfB family transposase
MVTSSILQLRRAELASRRMAMGKLTKEHAEKNKQRNRVVYNRWELYIFTQMLLYKCMLYGQELVISDERDTLKQGSSCEHLQAMPLWKGRTAARNVNSS